ncbi:hypothetical protein DCBHLPFO_00689 [Mycoplasmopsis arginini]|uniref:Uncharacterized protein n=1 Tax=Mycoplasmopsis arginini TaxID=2094 RepID=A0AA43TZS8_MYCAR|nr:hypothetical protein [Mycoplasmopsis arginini]
MWRFLPALPKFTSKCSSLPTSPMVARQRANIRRVSPDFRRRTTYFPLSSLPRIWALVPAERAIIPPPPGCISMLWINVPSGIEANGNVLPTKISTFSPEITLWPTLRPLGVRMYLFSPSAYANNEILAERFGSYSIDLTTAGILSLLRLKSIIL